MRIRFTLVALIMLSVFSARSQTTIRANALGWGLGLANVGFETALSKHFTFVAEGYYSPLWDTKELKLKGYNITPEVRYYFCEKFNKHYIGIHGNYADFSELQISSRKHIRDGQAYGAGVTYGHTWIFNHHWSLDIFGGVGWWHSKSDVYSRCEPDFMIEKDEVKDEIGLSRLGVTFGYRF